MGLFFLISKTSRIVHPGCVLCVCLNRLSYPLESDSRSHSVARPAPRSASDSKSPYRLWLSLSKEA